MEEQAVQEVVEGLQWLDTDIATFYAAVWAITFLVSFWRSCLPDIYKSIRVTVASSAFSGFFGVAVVAFLVGRSSDNIVGHWYYLCFVAPLVGALVKHQTSILDLIATLAPKAVKSAIRNYAKTFTDD